MTLKKEENRCKVFLTFGYINVAELAVKSVEFCCVVGPLRDKPLTFLTLKKSYVCLDIHTTKGYVQVKYILSNIPTDNWNLSV